MKLRDYVKLINNLAKKYPNAKVIYSIDDEGNDFCMVHYAPQAGNFNSDEGEWDNNVKPVNSVCIN